ncbi:MAG TPA: putative 2OG-Fe(II) oxygenase [Sphingobium sp.]|nr:putative 2OG-Fe(II) oxygenase [Sphingobium sp.]
METLAQALALLKAGRAEAARTMLAPLARLQPSLAEAHRLLAFAHLALQDMGAAEQAFAAAARAAPDDPSLPACLGELAANTGRPAQAEAGWRAALAIDPLHGPAVIGLARLLNAAGRPAEALAVTAPAVAAAVGDARLLDAHAAALTRLGRHAEALEVRQRLAAAGLPGHAGDQNLAAACLDLGHHGDAIVAADRAVAHGGDGAQLHYLRGRALQGLDRFDEADLAYRAALRRHPGYAEAARDHAHLIWMRTGDLDQALVPLDSAVAAAGDDPAPVMFRARLREFAGDPDGAYHDLAALAERHAAPDVHIAAARAAIEIDPQRSLRHLERARALAPQGPQLDVTLAAAWLALGEPQRAVALLDPLHRAAPHDQSLIAFLAAAWRMLDDPRYRALYDYTRMVGCWTLDVPPGWRDLAGYLADLGDELHALHRLTAHPVGQSLRQGTMAERNLLDCTSPAIRAFPQAVDGPIRQHLDWLGPGDDLLRARADDRRYRMAGLWTVRLQSGGFHVDHVHPMGWLSSACYVQLPDGLDRDRAGWLKFGEPGIRCAPALPAEHFIRPEPGRLVLFPSYMWHGTVPFADAKQRLSMAFDLLPGDAVAF